MFRWGSEVPAGRPVGAEAAPAEGPSLKSGHFAPIDREVADVRKTRPRPRCRPLPPACSGRPDRRSRAWSPGSSCTPPAAASGPSAAGSPIASSPTRRASGAGPHTCSSPWTLGSRTPPGSSRSRRPHRVLREAVANINLALSPTTARRSARRQPAGRPPLRRHPDRRDVPGPHPARVRLCHPALQRGGTLAGDIFLNTDQSWQINGSTYDLETGSPSTSWGTPWACRIRRSTRL